MSGRNRFFGRHDAYYDTPVRLEKKKIDETEMCKSSCRLSMIERPIFRFIF